MSLPDVGVWLAAVWGRHLHHLVVRVWFDRQQWLTFCRVTQMGLLRLLTNPSVMGDDVMPRSQSWRVVDRLQADSRVEWADEPLGLGPAWRALSARDDNSHKLWTDDYLAAFAQTGGITLATLDRAFAHRYPSVRVETLV